MNAILSSSAVRMHLRTAFILLVLLVIWAIKRYNRWIVAKAQQQSAAPKGPKTGTK